MYLWNIGSGSELLEAFIICGQCYTTLVFWHLTCRPPSLHVHDWFLLYSSAMHLLTWFRSSSELGGLQMINSNFLVLVYHCAWFPLHRSFPFPRTFRRRFCLWWSDEMASASHSWTFLCFLQAVAHRSQRVYNQISASYNSWFFVSPRVYRLSTFLGESVACVRTAIEWILDTAFMLIESFPMYHH